ncbi:nitroreductase/quinone reductase family protein [Glycomyces arizonensis]|uniref:nitroreductase/quinone reductase family protein n=1 Tax=Glycomyces arizonensis TaxID=256035 RepID=UPI000413CEC2|nr:nitroreductase/quinone reductase family protein [Glycomyces arizonensis]
MQTSDNDHQTTDRAAAADTLMLTTVNAETDHERTFALTYLRDGDRLLLTAEPGLDWHRDLFAHPMVSVAIGAETFGAVAVPAEDGSTVALERSGPEDAEVDNLADLLVHVHTWLRSQLRHVRAEADVYFAARAAHDGPGDAPKPGLGLQLRQHCLAFCQSLEFHHTHEDHMFPAIEGDHPHLREAIDRLRSEHRTVARIQGELAALLSDIGSADPAAFSTELDRLSEELTAHLDYEEEALIPVLAEIPFPPTAA